ncbi:MAG: FAD-dependent oxidoreductase [Deferribacteraceae bacterium]|jgi:fumarate reductase flavoprotein subunit|nr:FAD-dependent oxidoreductase [Deferribacteraceae bacterium]
MMNRILLSVLLCLGMSVFSFAADKTMNTDVVVVGAGAGGTSAAFAAVDAGLKVILLEKMPALGGSGNYMEGTFAVQSKPQIEDNIIITVEEQFKKTMEFHHWRINAKALNRWLKESSNTIDWIMANGVGITGVKKTSPTSPRGWHMFEGGHGSSLIKAFSERIRAKGGVILTETPAKELIFKNGRVTGVIAEDADGNKITVSAKAVIIATGGFPCNEEMIKKYLNAPYKFAGAEGRMGDGIQMMEKIGVELQNMHVVMQAGLWLYDVPTDIQFGQDGGKAKFVRLLGVLNHPYLLVSPRGERVVDETQPLEFISNAFENVGGQGFIVFDDDTRKEFVEVGLIRGYFGMVQRMTKFTDFDKVFAEGEKTGFAFKANSLNDLAKKTGMDAAVLNTTAATMNKLYEQRYDDQFYKDPTWLRPVKRSPFYALKGSLRMYSTTGGAKINEFFQPMTADDVVIQGLYAIGQDAGGLYGDSYDMNIGPGTASSWAITGGRLAVEHIKSTIKK